VKVEELSMYGKTFKMSGEDLKKKMKIVLHLLKVEFGYVGRVRIMSGVRRHTVRIKTEYPEAVNSARKNGINKDKDLIMLGALFCSIADRRGRKFSREFITGILQKLAHVSIPAIYQLDEFMKCEGDVFENFKRYTRAMFTEMDKTGILKTDGFHETEDLLEFDLISCMYAEWFETIRCPELRALCCDYSLAGYQLIEDAMQFEFRRPCTLAIGGQCCHLQFYRKGTAPDTALFI
jgi:hypothetical protein